MQIQMPEQVKKAISILNENGFKAYIVGGCVRDSLLGITPEDFDLTTNAPPEDIKKSFEGYKIIETGLKHGTLTVIIDRRPLEITAHRSDGEYSDNRRPDFVSFSKSLSEDLSRRDFTVNAMAYSCETGLIDELGSVSDLNKKIIRAVGDADRRFREDALRIIRALRFASVLGFEIEEKTSQAILRNRELLKNISAERINAELNKLICGECTDVLLKYRDVFAVFIPEIKPCLALDKEDKNSWEHTARSIGFAPKNKIIRLAMLLRIVGEKAAYDIMKRLRYDNATIKAAARLLKYQDPDIQPSEKSVRLWLSRVGVENLENLLKIKRADALSVGEYEKYSLELDEIKQALDIVIAQGKCFAVRDLAVNGDELKALNIPGIKIGKLLNTLLALVIEDKLPNEKEKLIEWAEKEITQA